MVLLVQVAAAACTRTIPESNAVADTAIRSLQRSDIDGTVMMFGMPAAFSRKETAEERLVLREMLGAVLLQFGTIREATRSRPGSRVYQISVSPGELANRNSLRNLSQYTFAVQFARGGRGVVTLDVNSVDGVSRLQQIHFGILASEPDALRIVSAAMRQEVQIVHNHRSPE